MPVVTLKFDLPEERADLCDALNGGHLRAGAQEFDNYLRGMIKYSQDLSDDKIELLEEIRSRFHEELDHKLWD